MKVKPIPQGRKPPQHWRRTLWLWLSGAGFVAIVSFSLWNGLMPNFVRLEQAELLHQSESIERQINLSKLDLLGFTTDLATWDDSYAYVAQPSSDFVQSNITPDTLYPNGIEYMAYFDRVGRVVFATRVTPSELKPPSAQAQTQLQRLVESRLASGLMRIDDQVLLVASAPVLPSSGQGDIRGYMVVARRFDVGKFSLPDPESTDVLLELSALATPTQPTGRNGASFNQRSAVETLNDQTQQLILLLTSFDNQTIAQIKLIQQRRLTQIGRQIVQSSVVGSGVLALLLVVLATIMLQRFEQEQQRRLALERRYREVVQQATEGMALVDGKTLEIIEANASLVRLLGYSEAETVGRGLMEFVPLPAAAVIRLCSQALNGEALSGEYQVQHRSGQILEVEGSLSRINDGTIPLLLVIVRDISERKQAEQTVRQNEARLNALMQNSLDMTLIIDPNGLILYATPNAVRIPQAAVGWMNGFDFFPPEQQEQVRLVLAESLAKPRELFQFEVNAPMPSGEPVWYEAWLQNLLDEPAVGGLVLNLRDISERKSYQDQIEHQALHDALTGLGNRRMLEDRAAQVFAIAERKNWPTSLIFLDLDRFKNINDTLGHHAGDELLVQMARLLRESVRLEDTLVRYSGDEFAVLLTDADTLTAQVVAERILSAVSQPVELRGHKLQLTVSMGIATSPNDGSNLGDLLKAADIAMYQAKRSGAGVMVYDPQLNPYSEDHLHLEASLRQAVAGQVFEFYYQPILDLRSSRIVSLESLVRWNNGGQWVSPAQFIPVAEELRLIERIDTLGLRRALEWLKANPQSTLEISLNLSAQTLRDPALAFYVQDLLEKYGLDASRLAFEITETALLNDLVSAQRILGELRKLGAKIALDDFGSGYASVGYLRNLPIDRLKLDRTMVNGIGTDAAGEQLLRAMIQLGHTLGMEVLAEGVETPEQLDWLRGHGCDLIQGYLIAKPQPPKALVELLSSGAVVARA